MGHDGPSLLDIYARLSSFANIKVHRRVFFRDRRIGLEPSIGIKSHTCWVQLTQHSHPAHVTDLLADTQHVRKTYQE